MIFPPFDVFLCDLSFYFCALYDQLLNLGLSIRFKRRPG